MGIFTLYILPPSPLQARESLLFRKPRHLVSMEKQVDETLQAVSYRSGSPKSETKSEDKESFIWQQPSWKEVAVNAGCLWRRARRGEASPGWRGVDGQYYTRTSLPEHLYFPPALRLRSELCMPGPSTSCTGLARARHRDQPEASLPQLRSGHHHAWGAPGTPESRAALPSWLQELARAAVAPAHGCSVQITRREVAHVHPCLPAQPPPDGLAGGALHTP